MLALCGKAYRRIFDAENSTQGRLSNNARFYVYGTEQRQHGQGLVLEPGTIDRLKDMLAEHNC